MVSRLRFYSFWLRTIAYSLPLWAFLLTLWFRFRAVSFREPGQYDITDYGYLLMFTAVLWGAFADRYRVSSVEDLLWERTGIRAAFSTCAATFIIQSVALFFIRANGISRAFVALNAVVLLCLTLVMRFSFRRIVGYHHKQFKPLRVMVVGADGFAEHVSKRLARTSLTSCNVVGYVRIPGQEVKVEGAPVYDIGEVNRLDLSDVDDIVIAVPLSRFSEVSEMIVALERLCKPVRAVMDLGKDVVLREKLFQFGNLQMVDLVTSPAETTQYLVMKRVFDVVFSLAVLVVSAPLLAVIALAIKLSSPGPVFFRQERVGLNGQLFHMHKFRTMRVAPVAESDTRWTTEHDPRRTRIGNVLRRTSLDELPQFLDVLRGDMSVVGPRPERPHFVGKFLSDVREYNERHRLKVGITGWAQVNGWRGDTSIEKRIECDLFYLQNWSLTFDMRIVAQTIWSGLINRNAY